MSFGFGFGFPKSAQTPGGATLNLQFAGATALDPRITFTRASSATYFDSAGVLQTAGNDVARLDYNPSTLAPLGLLIEEQRTNLVTYSAQFDNAAWPKTEATVTADTIVAPDGTASGDKLVANTVNGAHLVAVLVNVTSGTAYTFSFYAKAGEYQFAGLLFAVSGFGTNTVDVFNLSTGAVSTNASGTASIVSVGNGWYRCSATRTASATAASTFQIRVSSDSVGSSYAGNGYSGIFIWGAQLETGSFATSYIPTVAAQVTRSAESASMTGTNFSSWYNATEGSIYFEVVSAPVSNILQQVAYISDSSSNNAMFLRRTSSATPGFAVVIGGVAQADVNSGTAAASSTYKVGCAYKVDNFAISLNSGAVGTDTSGTIPVVSQINLGSGLGTSQFLNGSIKKFAFYPRRLSNTELQAITS